MSEHESNGDGLREGSPMWDAARSLDRESAGGLARVAAGAWMRGAGWGFKTYMRAGRRVTDAALRMENPLNLVEEAGREVIEGARRLLGVTDLERRLEPRPGETAEQTPLRERGAALLERSADVGDSGDIDTHPAYERILSEIAPDEARILRLLITEGAQPQVDVRTWRPLGIGSEIIAPGLSMMGVHAGCMHVDRVPQYLSNLFRLGLIWFSRYPLRDPKRYEVLEAQPEVLEAIKKGGRTGSTVRRSVELTPFGRHFCEMALPKTTAEFAAISADADPASTATTAEAEPSPEAGSTPV
jgi:hypothetical protein